MATPVHLDRAPYSAHLAAWGRHATGWWACVLFQVRIEGADELELPVAAWLPSHSVSKPGWSGGGGNSIPRLTLPDERRTWPAPPRWPSWYAGVWPDGPLPLPPGQTMVTGPGWRKRC